MLRERVVKGREGKGRVSPMMPKGWAGLGREYRGGGQPPTLRAGSGRQLWTAPRVTLNSAQDPNMTAFSPLNIIS